VLSRRKSQRSSTPLPFTNVVIEKKRSSFFIAHELCPGLALFFRVLNVQGQRHEQKPSQCPASRTLVCLYSLRGGIETHKGGTVPRASFFVGPKLRSGQNMRLGVSPLCDARPGSVLPRNPNTMDKRPPCVTERSSDQQHCPKTTLRDVLCSIQRRQRQKGVIRLLII
jgi:hypothetical protein